MVERKKQIDASVGKRIAQLRVLRGLSQKKLAACVGITTRQMRYYEHGRTSIVIERLHQIATALGCKASDLLPPPKPPVTKYVDGFRQIARATCRVPRAASGQDHCP